MLLFIAASHARGADLVVGSNFIPTNVKFDNKKSKKVIFNFKCSNAFVILNVIYYFIIF